VNPMRLVMMGTGTFAEPTFRTLLDAGEQVVGLVTQPERTGVKVRSSTRQTGEGMANIARAAGLPVLQPESINTPNGVAMLRELQPDLLVVAAYGQILKPEVIAVPRRGAINVHASLLPKYRGASPIAHALLQGETRTGVTIIRIATGLDSGDMLAQQAVDIGPDETTGELEARLAVLGARMNLAVVKKLRYGSVSGTKQDPALVTKAPKFTKEHGLIDWNQAAQAVKNHLRAMQPWPTAFTFLHRPGKEPMRIVICAAIVHDKALSPGEPQAEAGRLWIGCATGSLEMLEIQPAGKKPMKSAEFLRGYPVTGARFGGTSPVQSG
jgi:methionyl-tRNA formyltransferase